VNQADQPIPIDREAWHFRLARLEGRTQGVLEAESLSTDIRLLSAEDLARELGFTLRTIRRLDSAGRLPRPVRIGRAVRWRRAEVRAWANAGCPPRAEWVWRVP
jgi:excisionase family DNA binding protein